jgi:hypothetical protein
MKLVLGVTRNLSAARLNNWIVSASMLRDAEAHLIVLDPIPHPELVEKCKIYGTRLVHLPTMDVKVHHERYHYAWDYLRTLIRFEQVLWTDVADVVFQVPHLRWLDDLLKEHRLCVGSEGLLFSQEPWNMDNVNKTFPHLAAEMRKLEIICSGVIGGRYDDMVELLWNIYHVSRNLTGHDIVDQSALNSMFLNEQFSKKVNVVNTDQCYIVHCAVSGPTPFFTGWGFDKSYRYHVPEFVNGQVRNYLGEPFCLVHQYNRIPEWQAAFDKLYAK